MHSHIHTHMHTHACMHIFILNMPSASTKSTNSYLELLRARYGVASLSSKLLGRQRSEGLQFKTSQGKWFTRPHLNEWLGAVVHAYHLKPGRKCK
jgi:hypothetical protein